MEAHEISCQNTIVSLFSEKTTVESNYRQTRIWLISCSWPRKLQLGADSVCYFPPGPPHPIPKSQLPLSVADKLFSYYVIKNDPVYSKTSTGSKTLPWFLLSKPKVIFLEPGCLIRFQVYLDISINSHL